MKNSRNFLIIAAVAVLIIGGAGAYYMRTRNATPAEEEEFVPDLPDHMRPFTQLVPTEDGHYLRLVVEDINVPGASMIEYELLYDTSEGIQQGIPGRMTLDGSAQSLDRELLLGSESSGKFRYDQGVDDGKLTLKFRDVEGKFIGKVETIWKLYDEQTTELESSDGKFKYTLEEAAEEYYVVMDTFAAPEGFEGEIKSGPYGVFSSDPENENPGEVDLDGNIFRYDGEDWQELTNGASDDVGVFMSSN